MTNIDLLDLVVKTIEADPARWNQANWRTATMKQQADSVKTGMIEVDCKTAFCVAGWAVQLGSEDKPVWVDTSNIKANEHDDPAFVSPVNKVISAEDRATRLLGLDYDVASRLFNGSNTWRTVKAIVARIKADEP